MGHLMWSMNNKQVEHDVYNLLNQCSSLSELYVGNRRRLGWGEVGAEGESHYREKVKGTHMLKMPGSRKLG